MDVRCKTPRHPTQPPSGWDGGATAATTATAAEYCVIFFHMSSMISRTRREPLAMSEAARICVPPAVFSNSARLRRGEKRERREVSVGTRCYVMLEVVCDFTALHVTVHQSTGSSCCG